ncbi:hypothetical protein LCGC14_2888090, partial [marine sediment metagenome]
ARMLASAPSLLQDRFRGALARLEIDQQTQMLETLQRIATVMDAQQIDASPHLTSGSAAAAAEPIGPCRAPEEAPAQAGSQPPAGSCTRCNDGWPLDKPLFASRPCLNICPRSSRTHCTPA